MEAPVMAMVDTLVPGVSTLTQLVRYYGLYWALSGFADEEGLDRAACQMLVRRAEVGLALVSRKHDTRRQAHGLDRVKALVDQGTVDGAAELGRASYSPRPWGFWSQYGGPSMTLGTVRVDGGALRPGRHPCPPVVLQLFQPLLDIAVKRKSPMNAVEELAVLALDTLATPDLGPLGGLFTATRAGVHDPDEWTGDDHTRRATLRILARAVQLCPEAERWTDALHACVAYGDAVSADPVLADEERALAWRGVLLRHWSVGAWRRLWAALVDQVVRVSGSVAREDLYDWISSEAPAGTVRDFVADFPRTVNQNGHPLPAEQQVRDEWTPVEADLAVLLLGGIRRDQLSGHCLLAFLNRRSRGRGQFLDPSWVAYRHREHIDRPVAELARAFVDDMLAQSRRVALRKMRVDNDGRMTLFSKLHERNGRYFADRAEGASNVGLRIEQLGTMAEQLDLFTTESGQLAVTACGVEWLALPK
ncbi:hypothetical protein SaccyDRAFT_0017 [Saccharomonospora cyanea NA-134]|uniref:Uncharacterized protein n=1 Tax=Saccharomonospora cyanea NA-134 TaxID=882082 RepID=H5XPC5_9PSEU|nr:hypothetical protein SaccyDRAFT_0017 [Saccharomonospora cyanea NA-134]